MSALWSDRQICSHNVSQKLKGIKRLSEGWSGKSSSVLERFKPVLSAMKMAES